VMASGLRKIVPPSAVISTHSLLHGERKERELFAEYLHTAPRELDGFIITVCLYGGLFAWHRQSYCAASFLLALCAFLLSWKLRGDGAYASGNREGRSHAALRLVRATSTAVLITTGLLLLGLLHGVFSGAMGYLARDRTSAERRVAQRTREPRSQPHISQDTNASSSGLFPRRRKLWLLCPPRLRPGDST
jgi:hypothetical protein